MGLLDVPWEAGCYMGFHNAVGGHERLAMHNSIAVTHRYWVAFHAQLYAYTDTAVFVLRW